VLQSRVASGKLASGTSLRKWETLKAAGFAYNFAQLGAVQSRQSERKLLKEQEMWLIVV
jgi:hypothetical protein